MTAKPDYQSSPAERVLVELRIQGGQKLESVYDLAGGFAVANFELDRDYPPIPVSPHSGAAGLSADEKIVIVRGTIDKSKRSELEKQPNVIRVWNDSTIAPFDPKPTAQSPASFVQPMAGPAPWPIGTCDCSPSVAKGAIADVAQSLVVDHIWSTATKCNGIVVGIVDGGITAAGRPLKPGEAGTKTVPSVIGGWPTSDWGTTAAAWGNHGNMTATDVLGMAPEAKIFDIRISDGSFVSNALAGFQWAIDQHKTNGTPQVLSNSWGIFQQSWDPDYATNPNHPLTRKVVEAINEGILVLFAAGNCGATCPDNRCGTDTGPGRDIWGANAVSYTHLTLPTICSV